MIGAGSSGDWGAGYVTDIAYLPGYYPNQTPLHLNLACLLGGVAAIEITPETPLSYLELGCGHGFGALALAASNPGWSVTGIDFNPAHIAAARELAAAAGIANATFIEADLANLSGEPLARDIPMADVVTLHGLWSWVDDPVREGVVALLDQKVRPGGIVQVSYNALPGWQGALGLQRLLREAGLRLATRSDRQAEAGADVVKALAAANAIHLRGDGVVRAVLERLGNANSTYLAHEYMNAGWRPCFHADVVSALAPAKLDWVASAQLIENFSSLMLGEEAREVVNRFDDLIMRELIKDMCANRQLRQDVFVRGPRRLTNAQRDAALSDVMLGLLCKPEDFVSELDAPGGHANLNRSFYDPLVQALGQGPRRVRDLFGLPGLPNSSNPGEVVGMLVGTQQAMPLLAPATEPDTRVKALNLAAVSRFVRPDSLNHGVALATSGTGSPISCSMLDLFVVSQLQMGSPPAPAGWAEMLGAEHSEEERTRLQGFIEKVLVARVPVWRQLGALPGAASGAA